MKRAPPLAWLLALAPAVAGGLVAYDGLSDGLIVIRQADRRIDPAYRDLYARNRWEFRGEEARRIGVAGLLLSAAGLLTAFWGLRHRRVLPLPLALIAAAAVLGFPPWRASVPGTVAAFYGFLVPALAGTLACVRRGPGALAAGLGAGLALAGALGRSSFPQGVMAGLLAWIFLGGHLGLLLSERFRLALLGGRG